MPICRICREDKPETEFHIRKDTGKVRTECKDCWSFLQHERYLKYRAGRLQYMREYRAKNKDRINAENRDRYWKNINGRRTKLILRANPNYFKALERDQYICQLCKRPDSKDSRLLVHHLNNDRTDNKLDNLMTLCTPCHTITTWMSRIWITGSTIGSGTKIEPFTFVSNSIIGERNIIRKLCNIYASKIGNDNKIAAFVEIGGAIIGSHNKVEAHAFIPPGSVVEDYVFVGPHVVLTNDMYPDLLKESEFEVWKPQPVTLKYGCRIGGHAVILPGVTVGERCLVGAGSVVKYDTEPGSIYVGNPAHRISEAQKKKMGIP